MSKFFIPPESIKGNLASLRGSEAHHILKVMRLGPGDSIQAFDGTGKIYQGRISSCAHKQVEIQIEQVLDVQQVLGPKVTLVQALLKKNKMDYLVEKVTELGIAAIIPVATERSTVKLGEYNILSRSQRWQRIALAAAKQCGRASIPRLRPTLSWPEALEELDNFDLKLCFTLNEKTEMLKVALARQRQARDIVILIGPEGDFSPEEVEQATARGCLAVSLGGLVLKSDTAGICALAMLNYELR